MPSESLLITGASSDIGLAFARQVLSRPAGPLVLAHSHSGGARLQSLAEEFGDRVHLLVTDFRDVAAVKTMASKILAEFGAPTGVVHLPALRLRYERFTKFDWDRFDLDMAVQVKSAGVLLQYLLPRMAKLPRSKVLFVLSSVTRGMPPKFMSMYTVVKYAQLGLMRALAAEYASTGVRVNAISPGMVETQFLQEIAEVAVTMSAGSHPLGRNAVPEDLLGAMDFLLSGGADYITGVDLPVTGGSGC